MKISFDFDETLNRQSVQNFASWCIKRGHTVWIVTSRFPDTHFVRPRNWIPNEDLWDIATDLKIPMQQVVFTGHSAKYTYFKNHPDFVFHLDDDNDEIFEINKHTTVPCIDSKGSFWMRECKKLLND